ncbi:MAG: hypothetical protein IPL39_15035 [Opitutaceae bacterium]|nr:hypothetical protein [Opitutaceae bacterium]
MNTTNQIQAASGALKPEFLALPRPGTVCPVCGLGRSYLYQLIGEGKIQSVSLRQRGKTRGKRLIVADSVLAYLRTQIEPHQEEVAS